MGLFGGKKTYVSSTVYNLAGDEKDRPNFLKSLVVGNVITNTKFDVAETLQNGYMKGAGVKLRSFGRWSQGSYSDVMGTASSMLGSSNVAVNVLRQQIPHAANETVWIQGADAGPLDPDWWADQYMLENHKDIFDQDWTSDIDDLNGRIYIMLPNGNTENFIPANYDPAASYVYAAYTLNHTVHHDEKTDPITGEVTPAYDEYIYSELSIFIYKVGSGNLALDALIDEQEQDDFFFPIIPLRIDNKFVGPDKDQWDISTLPEDATQEEIDQAFKDVKAQHPVASLPVNFPEIYSLGKTAVKKSMSGKFDELVDNLAKNKSLKDIDYAYVVFGASLNTKENAAQSYLWDFFKGVADNQIPSDIGSYQDRMADYTQKVEIWKAWINGGSVGPEPTRPNLPSTQNSSIRVSAKGSAAINYDIMIKWAAMASTSGSALKKPEAKKGDVWWEVDTDIDYELVLYNPGESYGNNNLKKLEQVTLYKQITDNSWEAITIWDMVHMNWVYKGKSVEITAKEAIQDTEESGFIVPIHSEIYKKMSLITATQMGTACCYLVLNSYKVVKQKWYQTGIFKIFIFVAIIAISVFFPPFGAAGAGILGSGAAVGASLGLTGLAGVIAGAVANSIAAMLIMKAIGVLAVKLFGDKLGAIIGAIATVVSVAAVSGSFNGSSLSTSISQLARPENLIKLTEAGINGYAGYIRAGLADMQKDLNSLKISTNEKLEEIQDLYEKNIGYDRGVFDPTNLIGQGIYVPEGMDTFLSRTLMLGSDVIEFTQSLVTDFSALTLSTELPG